MFILSSICCGIFRPSIGSKGVKPIFTKFFGDHKINKTGYYTVNILGGLYRISYNLDNDEIIIIENKGNIYENFKSQYFKRFA